MPLSVAIPSTTTPPPRPKSRQQLRKLAKTYLAALDAETAAQAAGEDTRSSPVNPIWAATMTAKFNLIHALNDTGLPATVKFNGVTFTAVSPDDDWNDIGIVFRPDDIVSLD